MKKVFFNGIEEIKRVVKEVCQKSHCTLSFCIYLLFLVVYDILGMYYFSYLKISNTWLW